MVNFKDKEFQKITDDIINNKKFNELSNIKHHGISRKEHSVKIAYYSYKIARRLNWDYVSCARGGLLHDFFLNGNERTKIQRFTDTFVHPRVALKAAKETFDINKVEENIIISHMFPLYLSLPKYKESVLVNLVDKIIGGYEMLCALIKILFKPFIKP